MLNVLDFIITNYNDIIFSFKNMPLYIVILYFLWILCTVVCVSKRLKGCGHFVIRFIIVVIMRYGFNYLFYSEALKVYSDNDELATVIFIPHITFWTAIVVGVICLIAKVFINKSCLKYKNRKAKEYAGKINDIIKNKLLGLEKMKRLILEKRSQGNEIEKIAILLENCSNDKEILKSYNSAFKKYEREYWNELQKINNEYKLGLVLDDVLLSKLSSLCEQKRLELNGKTYNIRYVSENDYKKIMDNYKNYK